MPTLPPEGADPDIHVLALATKPEAVEKLRGALHRAGCDAHVACAVRADDAREYVRDTGAQGRLPDLVVVDLGAEPPALDEFLVWLDQRGAIIRIPTLGLRDDAQPASVVESQFDAVVNRSIGPGDETKLRQILADIWFYGDIVRGQLSVLLH